MIKKETLQRLVANKAVPLLESALTPHHFKFSKTRSSFTRKVKDYEQVIYVSDQQAHIEYDDDKGLLYLFFGLYSSVSIPGYNKWYLEKLGEKLNFSSRVSSMRLFTLLDFADFSESDFFTPSKAVAFKQYISGSLSSDTGPAPIPLTTFIEELDAELKKINEHSNIDAIFEAREAIRSTHHVNLLIYGGQLDKATDFYNQTYDAYVDTLTKEDNAHYLTGLEKFIKQANKLLGLNYPNPFVPTVKRTEDETKQLELIPGYNYRSILKFEGEKSKIRSAVFDETTGDCFVWLENKTLFRLDKSGNTIFTQQIATGSSFDHKMFTQGLQFVKNSQALILDRYILSADNKLTDIESMIRTQIKAKEKVNFTVDDAIFIPEDERYLLLCSFNMRHSILCHLDKEFNYVAEYYLDGAPIQIIPGSKRVVVNNGKHAFFDFDGKNLFELEYGNGNRQITISNNNAYAVSYGYATKSDLYELATQKGKVLWCHPTYVKNYKEVLYNDIHHNFDMSIAKFSPDDSYLIGGGHHGKYVAWTVPKFDRNELIPSSELLHLLPEAKIVDLDGVTFLKNRGYEIRRILFFNGSNNFLTQMAMHNFIWDKTFTNTGCLPIQGAVRSISEKYLTHLDENVFTIYRRVDL